MIYTKPELEVLWATENPGNGNPHLMAAIALAESAGNSGVVNSIGACGLWQIYPEQPNCQDPTANAKMAGAKLKSQGLGAWETYTNGSYQKFLGGGTTKNASLLGELVAPGSGAIESLTGIHPGEIGGELAGKAANAVGLGGVGKVIELLTSKDGWVRIGKVLVGIFLLLEGVLGMANISAVPTVEGVARKAVAAAAVA